MPSPSNSTSRSAGSSPAPYLCQLNVIDDAAGSFAFPRFAVLVREPPAATGRTRRRSGQLRPSVNHATPAAPS